MTEDDAKKLADYIAGLSDSARYRILVQRISRSIVKWLGILALATTISTFVLNGTDFFTKSIPRATASVSKFVLLSPTFRPYLVRQIAADLGYSALCTGTHQVIDLDGDRESTDLIVQFFPDAQDCKGGSDDAIYVILKESEWNEFLPKYTLLRTVSLKGLAYQMTFTKEGPFLIGSVIGADIAGFVIFGYANGLLHQFGGFQRLGNFLGDPPRGQVGNRLFLAATQGLMSFEVTQNGEFLSKRLNASEIVERNGTALIIEDESGLTHVDKADFHDGLGTYEPVTRQMSGCFPRVFVNGRGIIFTERNKDNNCVARLPANRAATIIANVRCKYDGFLQARQFPWGKVLDPTKTEHSIRCRMDDDDVNYLYELIVEIEKTDPT
jgi:hypothetical protein